MQPERGSLRTIQTHSCTRCRSTTAEPTISAFRTATSPKSSKTPSRKGGNHAHVTIAELARHSVHERLNSRNLPNPETPDHHCRVPCLRRHHLSNPRTLVMALARYHFSR